jgi:diguanylate cyclase (GGDEF)-like protein/PAS domain S-box-containing protein
MLSNPQAIRVLLVEDNAIEADLVRSQLAESRYFRAYLEHVTHVAAGLLRIAAQSWDVVLLDLNLPDGNGIDNVHRICDVSDRVPVVVLTNVEDDDIEIASVSVGAQDYLVKRRMTSEVLSRAIRYAIARHATETSLRESEQRFALATAGARDGIWDWNLVSEQVYYSPRWFGMLGLDASTAAPVAATWLDRVHNDDRVGLEQALQSHLGGATSHFEAEFRMSTGAGGEIWALARGLGVRDANQQAVRVAGSLSDITERKNTEEMLVHEALHDALTGLPNRNLFLDRLNLALKQFRRDRKRKFAVLFLDLDRFKAINDSLGHSAGDELLIEFGKRLSSFLRPGDSVARLGGDEFAILLMEIADLAEATRVAERVHDLLSKKFVIGDTEIVATASIGIALSDVKYEHSPELLRDADLAMYRTKRRQRGSHTVFDGLMHETALQRLELETDLRAALSRNELVTYYQPIVSLEHMRVTGFEALIRWFHPLRGLIGPQDFIPLAEECGVIDDLTWWIMTTACRQARAWQLGDAAHAELSISINISGYMFSQPDFAAKTRAVLERTGLPPHALHLEITENALLQHEAATIRELASLQNIGVKLHLDDFGTGYSSLTYLNLFAYDTIKIDRSFVSAQRSHGSGNRIVEALIGFARTLNVGVIVESAQQAQNLRELDCRLAQGFWFSKPLPAEAVQTMLAREKALSQSSTRNISQH